MNTAFRRTSIIFLLLFGLAIPAWAGESVMVAGIPLDFILFAMTLLGVALFHDNTLTVGLTGLATISIYKLIFTGFKAGAGFAGLIGHFQRQPRLV